MSSEIRFWVDVNEGAGQTSEMRVVSRDPKTRLANLAAELDIPLNGWELLVRPAPDGWPEPVPVGTAVGRRATLESLGVTPHSVILFRPGVT